jgi:hypothetical protein
MIMSAYLKRGNLKIRIEVSRKTNLGMQMPAGEVKVDEIVGDKDIELHAGHISISSAREWDYRNINASVGIGEVNARVFSADKGGFFRVFRKENADGEYRQSNIAGQRHGCTIIRIGETVALQR